MNRAMMMHLAVNMRQEPTIKSALPEREGVDKSALASPYQTARSRFVT